MSAKKKNKKKSNKKKKNYNSKVRQNQNTSNVKTNNQSQNQNEHKVMEYANGPKEEEHKVMQYAEAPKEEHKVMEYAEEPKKEEHKVMEYAAEGPAYIAQQMSNKIESIQQNIEKTLNDQYKIVEDNINTFCEGEGNKIGEKLVQEYNNLIDKAAKATFEKTNNAKTQGIVKGTTAIQEAKLKLFALIGV